MMKIAAIVLAVATLTSSIPQTKFLNCGECIFEMQHLSYLIKQEANLFEAYLTDNYCPGLGEFAEQCENEMVGNYVQALFMVVQHYFVDGAAHICQAAGICDVKGLWEPQPRPYTCEECVQGLELVGQYMVDPLWVADFTLYLELNFCVGHPPGCPDRVKEHFPAMHAMIMEAFWDPQTLCNLQPVCGGTKPPVLE